MEITTRVFGKIEIDDNKIIHFPSGIIGFPDMTDFALVYDEEKGKDTPIRWLQSLQEAEFALPVMDPLLVAKDYNPEVDDEILKNIGTLTPDNTLVLVTVTVPSDLTKMSVNLQGPIIINVDECKACQVIVDTPDCPVKYPIYDILQARKAGE